MRQFISVLVVLMSVNAFATKARIQALSNSFHLVDTQTIFVAPLDLMAQKNYITFEAGSTAATSGTDGAEGSISYGINDHSQAAFSIGHKDDAIIGTRTLISNVSGTTYDVPQNPIHLNYGIKLGNAIYAGGVEYSNKNDAKNSTQEKSAVVSLGAQFGDLQAYTVYSLLNTVEATGGKKLEGAGYVNVAGRYSMDTLVFGLDYYGSKGTSATNGIEDLSLNYESFILGLVNSTVKDGTDFFYGAQLINTTVKNRTNGKDLKRTALPVWFGVEAKAKSWLTVRGSIQQTVLLSQVKDEQGFSDAGGSFVTGATGAVSNFPSAPNNTTAAFGVGINLDKVTIDGTLKGLIGSTANQKIDGTNLLAQAGMTYNF